MSTPLVITDPTSVDTTPRNALERWFAARIRDPRDLYMVRLLAVLSVGTMVPAALFYSGVLPIWAGFLWIPVLFITMVGRFTLLLHAVCHRAVFKREHRWMERYVPWVLGPFFGQTPMSFYVHHMGMHHPENNLDHDLSTTLPYRRDSKRAFAHYWARFFFFGWAHTLRYLSVRGRSKLFYTFVRGELAWLTAMAVLLYVNPGATLVVFLVPFVLIRFLMMAGNWGQHAFVDVDDPGNCYRNSINIINSSYNRTCFNDGYHIVHHIKPALHWTEMPVWFQDNLDQFGANDAVVFDGIGDNTAVWFWLMLGNYGKLADHLVQLPGAPVRTRDEKIAFLQQRVLAPLGEARRLLVFDPKPVKKAA